MYRVMLFSVLLALTAAAVAQNNQPLPSGAVNAYPSEPTISSNGPVVEGFGAIPKTGDATEIKIAKRVRHELLMLPYYSLFDDLEYTVQGRTVTLSGYVTSYHSLTKQSAEKTVRKIEGVEKVVNNIQVLSPAPFDEQLRRQADARLIRAGGLSQYFWQASPSIHIIVLHQNVILKGYVDRESDKELAGITVRELTGAFGVTNDLQVVR
jgi:hyperosmotically inducible protein